MRKHNGGTIPRDRYLATSSTKQYVYTLITGASRGIGNALAKASAQRGQHVLMVAQHEPRLQTACLELQKDYPNQVFDWLALDLTEPKSTELVYNWCLKNGYDVNILINNAGIGGAGAFQDVSGSFHFHQMQLNIVALTMLTHLFLPGLRKHKEAYVLNIASMAAFYDIPNKSIYTASKRFVYSFSRSFRKELEHTSVGVTVVCPASVITNPDVLERDQNMGVLSKLTRQTPEQVAIRSLQAMYAHKAVVIPGFVPNVYYFIGKLIPYRVKLHFLARSFRKQQQAVGNNQQKNT